MSRQTIRNLSAHAATHVGLVRAGNEDSVHCGTVVFTVADGLGGHAAGEVASQLAVESLAAVDPTARGDIQGAQETLAEAVREANRVVHAAAQDDPSRAGMGTTLTAAVVHEGQAALAHVGDSRAYLHRAGDLRQLTKDHTAAQEAVDAGHLTPEQAAHHPERHALARAVGLGAEVEVDTPPPLRLEAGDRLLLCSDGLIDPVSDEAIGRILEDHPEPAQACDALVQAALDGGGPDNVTVLVVRVDA